MSLIIFNIFYMKKTLANFPIELQVEFIKVP